VQRGTTTLLWKISPPNEDYPPLEIHQSPSQLHGILEDRHEMNEDKSTKKYMISNYCKFPHTY